MEIRLNHTRHYKGFFVLVEKTAKRKIYSYRLEFLGRDWQNLFISFVGCKVNTDMKHCFVCFPRR